MVESIYSMLAGISSKKKGDAGHQPGWTHTIKCNLFGKNSCFMLFPHIFRWLFPPEYDDLNQYSIVMVISTNVDLSIVINYVLFL